METFLPYLYLGYKSPIAVLFTHTTKQFTNLTVLLLPF